MSTKKPHPGRCSGCLQHRDLFESHLLPAHVYRRAQRASGEIPVTIEAGRAVQVSNQLKAYLLCADCEDVLRRGGENYIVNVMYRPDGDCPLYDMVGYTSHTQTPFETRESRPGPGGQTRARPAFQAGVGSLYRVKVTHLALGVLWRFSVAQHPRAPSFRMEPERQEQIRQFLFDGEALPRDVHLRFDVLDLPRKADGQHELLDANLHNQTLTPWWETIKPTWREARLLYFGFLFRLFVGRAPEKLVRGALTGRAPWHIYFVPPWDHLELPVGLGVLSEEKGRLARS
jgi:hypothetical protein